jgi:class 3 adenylate cyclase
MTDDELTAEGLFDPESDSPRRAELVRRCLDVGMTVEEIRQAGDDLVPLAIDAIFRVSREQLTLAEVAERAGVDDETLAAIARATGFAGPNRDQRVWNDDDVASMAILATSQEFLGDDALQQILRTSTAAVGRIGDAVMSTFLTSAGAAAMAEDDSGLGLVEANQAGAALLEGFGPWLTRALTRHLRVAFRDSSELEMTAALDHGVDTPVLAIGFADLIGSTSHAERRTLVELNAALHRFELTAIDVVNAHGGRIVKFIGDEVMFRAADADVAAAIALDLVDEVRADDELPPIRAAVTYGMVLSREGDFHGPTVNLAARILKLAPMNGVVASLATAESFSPDAGIDVEALGAIEMQGMAEPVELAALRRS